MGQILQVANTGPNPRPIRGRVRGFGMVLVIVASSFLTSCTAAPATDIETAPAATPAGDVCMEVSDLGTLLYNMQNGRRSGQIPGEVYQGAMYLAASMLGHIDVSDDSEVNSAVDGLKAATGPDQVDPDSERWITAFADVSEKCTDVLGEFGVVGWAGV